MRMGLMGVRLGLVTLGIGLLLQTGDIHAFEVLNAVDSFCQNTLIDTITCNEGQVLNIFSVTVLTNSDSNAISTSGNCGGLGGCARVIHNSTDTGISNDYRHLYQWIISKCQGRNKCAIAANDTLPEWWALIDDSPNQNCSGQQYFAAVLIHYQCWIGPGFVTVAAPNETTPRTRPTTPTTTTPFPIFIAIYQAKLEDREKTILGVAIGLALAVLLVLLIVLYCCEKYRHSKRFGKLLRRLGAPQAEDNAFDELDYGRKEAWRDETQNLDALGEYTGVKPDEFLTLDKQAMVSSGQIMYDTPTGTMRKGNSCSTLDRLDRKPNPTSKLLTNHRYQGPTDYETEENLELERRMAATLGSDEDITVNVQADYRV